jgi:hypothetical protein
MINRRDTENLGGIFEEVGLKTRTIIRFLLWLSPLCLILNSPLRAAETRPDDPKEAAVNAFMAARTLADNVEARKLMTAGLEKKYLRGRGLSTRMRSGRVVAFDFNPSQIQSSGDKEFQVEVSCVWADLNELAYETQFERLKFVTVEGDWLADDIDLLRKVPFRGLPQFSLEEQKAGKAALAVAKKFAKALVNRNPKLASQYVSEEYQNQFRGSEAWENFIAGRSAPRYAAYDLRDLTFKGTSEVEVKIGLYQVESGRRGLTVAEARLFLQEGKTDWHVDDFQLIQ